MKTIFNGSDGRLHSMVEVAFKASTIDNEVTRAKRGW
jgi:hypothetical protein